MRITSTREREERFRDAVPLSIFLEDEETHGLAERERRDAAWRNWLRWISLITSRDTAIAQALCDATPHAPNSDHIRTYLGVALAT